MNILLFPTRFYPAISGGDFYVERIGEEFQKIGNNTNFITSNALDFGALHGFKNGKIISKNHKNYSRYRNLNIKRFKTLKISDNVEMDEIKEYQQVIALSNKYLNLDEENLAPLLKNGPLFPELNDILMSDKINVKIFRSIKPDLIHCSYLPYSTLIYTLLLSKKLQIPSVVTPFLHSANKRYKNNSIFKILKKFNAIMACTSFEKKIYTEYNISQEKIHVLPMGVDINKFKKNRKKRIEIVRKIYNLKPKNHPIILFCGYKNYEKGGLTLLNSIISITKERPGIIFVFIGPPTTAFNYTLRKIKKKKEKIKIINITPENLSGIFDTKKIGLFQVADIFCMPSRSDAYGIAYLEAWATKTPVIGANFPAMQEVINNGKDGILINFDDTKQLKETIISMLNNEQKLKKMGAFGYNKVLSKNNWNDIAKKTLIIYKNLIQKKKSETELISK